MSDPRLCRHCGEVLLLKGQKFWCRNGCEQLTARPLGDDYVVAQQHGVSEGQNAPSSHGLRRMPTNRE